MISINCKEELFNKIIEITKKTGQGLASFVIDKGGWQDLIDELISDGLIVKYTQTYAYLPNDIWYCLNNGIYNVESDKNNNHIHYMRYYLGIEDTMVKGFKMSDLIDNNREQYEEFVEKNHKGLEAIKNLTPIPIQKDSKIEIDDLTKSIVSEIISNSDQQITNYTDFISSAESLIRNKNKIIRTNKELLPLYKYNTAKYANDIINSEKDIIKCNKEITGLNKIKRLVNRFKQDGEKIEDFISIYS